MRMTRQQALALGIPLPSEESGVRQRKDDRTRKFKELLREVREARCDVVITQDGKDALVRVVGATVPSLNAVLRYNMQGQFHAMNQAWHDLIGQATLAARSRRLTVGKEERVNIHVHGMRGRLLDPDNVCVKAIVDGCVRAGILPDDAPKYVGNVSASQAVDPLRMVYVELKVVSLPAAVWAPDPALLGMMPVLRQAERYCAGTHA